LSNVSAAGILSLMRMAMVALVLFGCDGAGGGPAMPMSDAGTPADGGVPPVPDAGVPDLPDGAVAASGLGPCVAAGGTLSAVDVIDNNVVTDHGDLVTIALSSGGEIGVASADGALKIWTVESRLAGEIRDNVIAYETAFGEHVRPVSRALAYAPDGAFLAAGSDDGAVNLWDTGAESSIAAFDLGDDGVTAVAVRADGAEVAMADASHAGNVRVAATTAGATPSDPIGTGLWGVASLLYLPDGTLVLAGHQYGVPMVELHAAGAPATTTGSFLDRSDVAATLRGLAATSDGRTLVAAGGGVLVVLDRFDPATPLVHRTDVGHDVIAAAVLPDDRHFATVATDHILRVHDLLTGDEVARFVMAGPVAVHAHAGGDQLVAADASGRIHLVRCFPAE
jgi:WD40 repeat protein